MDSGDEEMPANWTILLSVKDFAYEPAAPNVANGPDFLDPA